MIMVYKEKLVDGIKEKIKANTDEKIKTVLLELLTNVRNGEYGEYENGYDD